MIKKLHHGMNIGKVSSFILLFHEKCKFEEKIRLHMLGSALTKQASMKESSVSKRNPLKIPLHECNHRAVFIRI